ncbi:MAG TPA: hypothetical protein VFE19_05765 [Jatrophihabitantaceae bacterium]|nr:hypothetical protein [Jatrophihabitantaceae bacterium]
MRHLDDLEAAWTLLEERADAYPLHDLTASRPRVNRARPKGLAIAVSAAVVGTAAVAAIASGLTNPATQHQQRNITPLSATPISAAVHHHKQSVQRAAPTLDWATLPDDGHYLLVFDQMPGTTVTSVIGVGNPIDPGGHPQYQEVQTTGPNGGLVFKVNPDGGWHPNGGTPVTVNGTQGYYGSFLLHPEIPGHPVHPRVALAWQYAPNSWVTVASTSMDPIPLDKAQRIAGLVQIGEGDSIPNPPPPGP